MIRCDVRMIAGGLLAIACAVTEAAGRADAHQHHSLGTVDFPVSCSTDAQQDFNRALALLHHMTYPQSRAAFQELADREPGCAMAHWGIAMTLFQPLWPTRPSAEDLRRGHAEVQKATALGSVTQREQLFIAAAAAFFEPPQGVDYWQRIQRWKQAALAAHQALPGDAEAALFHALAELATMPANSSSRDHADRVAAILVGVYERNPDHPGVMHYLIHANDVPGRERELLDVTQRYELIAPNNPHALHMPTHIYTRLGEWNAVIKGNLRAAEAALLYPSGARGEWVWDEFAHAIEYLVYAYLQQGADTAAAFQLGRLQRTERIEPSFKTAFHIASTQSRYALERRDWAAALAIVPRSPAFLDWDRYPWAEATTRFARGLGAVHLRRLDEVSAELARLEQLEAAATRDGETLFARSIAVLRLELSAWLAHSQDRHTRSVELMREAVQLEISTPKHAVTPGPTLPSYELLGDLHLARNEPQAAFAAYEASLQHLPGRFNSLAGAARAASRAGDHTSARKYFEQLQALASAGSQRAEIAEAREYLKQR